MLFSYGYGQQQISDNKKFRQTSGDFDCHADAAVRRGAHRPIEHVQGFTWSHCMPPSGECLCRIAPAAIMVEEFVETTLNTTKTQLLPSNYGTFDRQLFVRISYQNRPSTQLIDDTPQLELKCSQTFLAIKCCQRTKLGKVIKLAQRSIFKWAHICAHRG